MEYVIVLISLGFLYLFLKPTAGKKTAGKTKAQKQEEIFEEYKQIMDKELTRFVDDKPLFKQRKTALLKRFASELNRNVFFNVEDTKKLIQRLINGK